MTLHFWLMTFLLANVKKLKEISKLRDNIIFELDREIREKNSIKNDIIRIEKSPGKIQINRI